MVELCEIQKILYEEETTRTPQRILRLHNLTFLHTIHLIDILKSPNKLTKRKLFGQYFHALVSHAAQQYRIMSLPSANTEDEERSFNTLKTTSASSSNHHGDNVLLNAFIRLQVKNEVVKEAGLKKTERKNVISRHSSLLSRGSDTIISFKILKRHPEAYQAHLERISDFLMMKLWEETEEGVKFFDLKESNKKFPPMHHFRSSNMSKEYRLIQINQTNI